MASDELLDKLKEAAQARREYAGFFSWHDRSPEGKALAECGAARDLFVALARFGKGQYEDPCPSGDQWPDCEAIRSDGALVAIEVTELVDEQKLRSGAPPEPWSKDQLLEAIRNRLTAKDRRAGGSYDEVILLIHTDEFYLTPREVMGALQDVSFQLELGNLHRAFLLLSYWPQLGHCPAVELKLLLQQEGE